MFPGVDDPRAVIFDQGPEHHAMVEIATASLPSIEATLNYVAARGEKLVSYAYEPPPGVPLSTVQVEGHPTTIHDLRPAASNLTLDEVGFKLLTHRSAVKDFWDEEEIKRVYIPNPSSF
jgi:hypothetical protein